MKVPELRKGQVEKKAKPRKMLNFPGLCRVFSHLLRIGRDDVISLF